MILVLNHRQALKIIRVHSAAVIIVARMQFYKSVPDSARFSLPDQWFR